MAGALALGSAQAQVPTPAQAPADFSYSPVSPGSWSYRAVAGGSEASFVDGTGAARMVIACGKMTRLVTLSRISAAPASSLSFWTSSLSRNLASRFDQPTGRVIAQVGSERCAARRDGVQPRPIRRVDARIARARAAGRSGSRSCCRGLPKLRMSAREARENCRFAAHYKTCDLRRAKSFSLQLQRSERR